MSAMICPVELPLSMPDRSAVYRVQGLQAMLPEKKRLLWRRQALEAIKRKLRNSASKEVKQQLSLVADFKP